jgi:hypothetical protein
MNIDEMKNKISMALKDPILQQGFEIICKENAELEKVNTALRQDWDVMKSTITDYEKENAELKEQKEMLEKGYVWHDYDAGEDCYEDTHEGKWVKRDEVYQLTKAKEIISEYIRLANLEKEDTVAIWQLYHKAEQFLSEVENDNR